MTFTAWQLIGWQHGPIRIVGGRTNYEEARYECSRNGRCVKLMRLKVPDTISNTVIRYVEPETQLEIVQPISNGAEKFLRFQGLI